MDGGNIISFAADARMNANRVFVLQLSLVRSIGASARKMYQKGAYLRRKIFFMGLANLGGTALLDAYEGPQFPNETALLNIMLRLRSADRKASSK